MYFYIEFKRNSYVVKSIKRIQSPNDLSTKEKNIGIVVQDEDEEPHFQGDCICVINVSDQGKEIYVNSFSEIESAKKCFKTLASSKFSNWDEYSSKAIDSVLKKGYEKTSGGSLCFCEAN